MSSDHQASQALSGRLCRSRDSTISAAGVFFGSHGGLSMFGLAQFGLAQSGWACLFEATESERQGGVYCRVMCCFRFMYLRGRALKVITVGDKCRFL